MEAALAFAAEVGTAASQPERADHLILERLAHATGSELAGYDQLDASCNLVFSTEIPGPAWMPTEHEWGLLKTQNPFSAHAARIGSATFGAVRLSDVVDMRSFRLSELYAVHDDDIDFSIQARMPAEEGGHWTLELGRSGRDYSSRDLLFLHVVTPAIIGYEAYRALGAKVAELRRLHRDAVPGALLSVRENEVLDLVASGATNAQIAERLWISPATVKKHLENVYAKLEVGGRIAAMAITGRSQAATEEASPGL